MTTPALPKWILIVSGFFAVMEIGVSISLCLSPESALENVDLSARGVLYLVYMWAARQLALGVIFAYATWRKSVSMLTITYLFFLVMFMGDLVIGFLQNEYPLIISAVIMCTISISMIIVLSKRS